MKVYITDDGLELGVDTEANPYIHQYEVEMSAEDYAEHERAVEACRVWQQRLSDMCKRENRLPATKDPFSGRWLNPTETPFLRMIEKSKT